MPNKPNPKNKTDLKLTITAVAFTLALAFWNFLSAGARKTVQTASDPAITPDPAATQMTPVKILLGGPAPATTVVAAAPVVSQPRTVVSAPKPVTRTRSSQP